MEKLSELTSILLTIFASWRTGDKKRLGKNKNTNKANPKSDLQNLEVVYVSEQYTGQSELYVNLEAIPSSHSFPLSFCGLVGLFVFCVSSLMFLRLFMLLLPWLAGRDCWGARGSQIILLGTTATSFKLQNFLIGLALSSKCEFSTLNQIVFLKTLFSSTLTSSHHQGHSAVLQRGSVEGKMFSVCQEPLQPQGILSSGSFLRTAICLSTWNLFRTFSLLLLLVEKQLFSFPVPSKCEQQNLDTPCKADSFQHYPVWPISSLLT